MKKYLFSLIAATGLLPAVFSQNVGIGTASPQATLDVNGTVKLGATNATPVKGTVRWNEVKSDFEGFNGERWVSFTGGKSVWGNAEQFATENGGVYAGHSSDTSFGEPISMSGTRLAIAVPKDENGIYRNSGAVHVRNVYSNGQTANSNILYSPNIGNHYYFGQSVAVNNAELVVGEPGALKDGNTQQGRAYVYKLDVSNQAGAPLELVQTAGDPFDRFGSTVAISGDYIAVAATDKNESGKVKQGRIYTYRRLYIFGAPTDAFLAESNFTAPDGTANMKFGGAISVSPTCMVVSAPNATVDGDVNAGKVYIYRRVNNAWQYEATLTANNPLPNSHFGASVSVNATGDTLVVGTPRQYANGFVSIFVKNGANWQFSALLQEQPDDLSNGYGCSVDFKNGKILVGSRDAKVGINYQQGKAYLYSRSGSSWVKEAAFTPQNGDSYLQFGASVQLGAGTAVVSAPGYVNQYFKVEKGRVYWFVNN